MKNLQQHIRDIAKSLQAEGQIFTRSDLAYQLQEEGVKDDFELEKVVYLAQKEYKFSKSLFITNDRRESLVDAYEMHNALDVQQIPLINDLAADHTKNIEQNLKKAEKALDIQISEEALKTAGNVMGYVTGTNGIARVRARAEAIFGKYTEMVEMYGLAKDSVTISVDDFVALRGDVQKQFLNYASALTDIFGDNIKAVAPDMFDFKQIKWLDVTGMHKQIALDFNTITAKCSDLLATISDNFRNSLQQSCQTYKVAQDKRVGLVLAGFKMVEHYLDAYSQETSLKGDLSRLEKSMARDKTLIQGDLMRLTTIHKALNDVQIPRAVAFLQYSKTLLDSGLQEIIDSMYLSPKAKEMRQTRENLLQEIKRLDKLIQDETAHINYYTNHIRENKELLQNMQSQYQNAKQTMPIKPFFLFNWFTFGSLGRNYRREMFAWNQTCMPVVKSYEDLELDVTLDSEDLSRYKQFETAHKKEHEKLRISLDKMNSELMSLVNANDVIKKKLLRSLKDILRLMALAKEITQAKINDNLIRVVNVHQFEDFQLPAEINCGLETFFGTLHDNLHISRNDAADIIDEFGSSEVNLQNYDKAYSEEDLQITASQSDELLHKSIDVCQQMIELQKQVINTEAAKIHYQQEYQRLKKLFQNQYQTLVKRSNSILDIMAELNTANSSNDIKEALLKLSDGKLTIPSDEDLQEFIKGHKQIVI